MMKKQKSEAHETPIEELANRLKRKELSRRQFVQFATKAGLSIGVAFSMADEVLGSSKVQLGTQTGEEVGVEAEFPFIQEILDEKDSGHKSSSSGGENSTRAYNRFSRAYNRFSRAYNRFSR